jgi:adenosylhomocysteine nucleosidase
MPSHPAAIDRRCDIGIVFALAIEADAFERRVADRVELRGTGPAFHEGRVAGARVAWCVSGVGGPAAARATRLLIDGHGPRLVVSAGFAGGLDPALPRGAVVRPDAVIAADADAGPRVALTPAERGGDGLLVSVGQVAATVAGKRRLAERTAAGIVDMETHAIATVAAAAGLPCHAVRVVSDDASQPLPAEVVALARPQSPLRRLGAVLGAVGRRPAAAVELWRLYEHAVVDGRALAAALERLCREIALTAARPAGEPAGSAADPRPAP